MRLGFFLPHIGPWAGPEPIARVATRAEEAGFDSLWVTERSLFPVDPQTPYPGGPLSELYKWALDPLDTLTWVASQTKTIDLGTSIVNLLWYSPLLLARRLTTIDVLSNGRLKVGLGQGWSKDEYDAAGTPWTDRGKRFDEALEALKAVWTTDPVEVKGAFYTIPRSYVSLKPVQKPHPPLYMAAFTPPALQRTARYADGWNPVGIPLAALPEMFDGVKSLAADAGRDPSALKLVVRANMALADQPLGDDRWDFAGSKEQIAGDIAKAREIGADELIVDVTFDPGVQGADDFLGRLDLVSSLAKESAGVSG